mgnify:CR=1 FL=1
MTTRTSYPLKLPLSIKQTAQRLAREDGVSLNQWIAVAIAEKIGAVETANDFLNRMAQGATPADLFPFLTNARRESPAAGDELR